MEVMKLNEVIKTIHDRRSIRAYKSDPVSQADLELLIDAAVHAPTAHNNQPWHFTIIENKELLDRINVISKEMMAKSTSEWMRKMASKPGFRVTYDAPVLVVVSGRLDSFDYKADCAAAIENMILAAESIGIASVWLGLVRFFFEIQEEVKKLGLPEGYVPYYGVAFGYSANETKLPGPKRNLDVVNYIR
jgi:nitroreductase